MAVRGTRAEPKEIPDSKFSSQREREREGEGDGGETRDEVLKYCFSMVQIWVKYDGWILKV